MRDYYHRQIASQEGLAPHEQGAANWGVTLKSREVALNIGGFYACWIKPGEFYVSVMEEALDSDARSKLDRLTRRGEPFKRITGTQCLYIPLENVNEVLPLLRAGADEFIAVTAVRFPSMGARVEGAHSPGVLDYFRDYLEQDLPEPNYNRRSALTIGQLKIWKIAPGKDAFLWSKCHGSGCLALGALKGKDLRSFQNKKAMVQALLQAGEEVNFADSLWRFVHDVKPGDIVVGNRGNDQVVGVGVVTSDYLPANANVPSVDPSYTHVRLVDWRVAQSIKLSQAFFGRVPATLFKIGQDHWQRIRQAYILAYPNDNSNIE